MADGFYGPRSRANARLLIDTAKALGLSTRVVKTQMGGYSVPVEIIDAINADLEIKEEANEVETTEEQGDQPKRPGQNDPKADWLTYAQATGLDVTEDSTKAEIIDAVKKAEEGTD